MRARVIAVWIPRAPVENARTSASAFARAAAPHEFPFIALRTFDAHGDWPRVLALRITGATNKLAEACTLLLAARPARAQCAFPPPADAWFCNRDSRCKP